MHNNIFSSLANPSEVGEKFKCGTAVPNRREGSSLVNRSKTSQVVIKGMFMG